MFEFVVDDLLITTLNECAPEEYPTYVEMTFRSQCYVSICDQEQGGCMEATCRNGKCALFALTEAVAENDQLFVHVYKRRPGKKCKFLLGLAAVPVHDMFRKVTRHFHEENPSLVSYLGISLYDEEDNNAQRNGNGNQKRQSNAGEKRQSTAGEKRKSTADGKGKSNGKKQKEGDRKKGGQDQEKKEEGAEEAKAEEAPKEEDNQAKPAEKRESARPKKRERRRCPERVEPPPPDYAYKTVCQQMAADAQAAKDSERYEWELECRDRYEPERDRTGEEQQQRSNNNNNGGNGDGQGEGECGKEPLFVAGCMTEMNPRQEEYCPTAEISKKLLSLLHCNGKQTGNIVMIIRLSCMGPCIVSPFIFGKNSMCQPPLCAPDCEPAATMPCSKKKGRTDYPVAPNPPSTAINQNPPAERATGGGVGGTPSCCPSTKKKCCKPTTTIPPVHRFFNCDPCAGCPFAERPCDTPNCRKLSTSKKPKTLYLI